MWSAFLPAILATVLAAGCSSSSNPDDMASTPSTDADADSPPVAQSDVLNERFGTVTERDPAPLASDATQDGTIAGFNRFALDVHRALASSNPTANTIVSPYNLSTALSLTLGGTAGDAYSSLAALLHLDAIDPLELHQGVNTLDLMMQSRSNDSLRLQSVQRLFVKQGLVLNDSYLDLATGQYGAPVVEADFANRAPEVAAAINDWINNETDGLITSLVEEPDPNAQAIVLNTLLMDAAWRDPYQDLGTASFTTLSSETIDVPYFGHTRSLAALVEDGLKAVQLPYVGSELAMLLLLPDDIASFEQALSYEELARIVQSLNSVEVNLAVPEWQIEQPLDARELLTPLGLPTGPMDFSAMIAPGRSQALEISKVDHAARIKVDRYGTVAGASTAVELGAGSVPNPPEPIAITLDRPFVYLVRDLDTGTILFTGHVTDPR